MAVQRQPGTAPVVNRGHAKKHPVGADLGAAIKSLGGSVGKSLGPPQKPRKPSPAARQIGAAVQNVGRHVGSSIGGTPVVNHKRSTSHPVSTRAQANLALKQAFSSGEQAASVHLAPVHHTGLFKEVTDALLHRNIGGIYGESDVINKAISRTPPARFISKQAGPTGKIGAAFHQAGLSASAPNSGYGHSSLIPGVAGKVGRNFTRQLFDVPGEIIPSTTYVLGAKSASEIASRQLGPFVQLAKHPGKEIVNHPLTSALMAAGVYGTTGRFLGGTARAVRHEAGATKVGEARIPGTHYTENVRVSRNLINATVQKKAIRRQAQKAAKLRDEANTLVKNGKQAKKAGDNAQYESAREQAQRKREQANRIDPFVVSAGPTRIKMGLPIGTATHGGQRAIDMQESVANGLHKTKQGIVNEQVRQDIGPIKGKHQPLVFTTARGITAATHKDITAYIGELEKEHGVLVKHGEEAKAKANEKLRGDLQKALDTGANLENVLAAANRYAAHSNERDRALVDAGILNADQASKARLMPAARRNLGHEYDAKSRPTDAAYARAIAKQEHDAAKKQFAATQRVQVMAEKRLAKAHADARVSATKLNGKVEPRIADRLRNAIHEVDQAKAAVTKARETFNAASEVRKTVREQTKGQPKRFTPGLVDKKGKPVSAEQLRKEYADLKNHNPYMVEQPAAIGLGPDAGRASNFYSGSPFEKAQNPSGPRLTGKSVLEGTYDVHPRQLRAHAAKQTGLLHRAQVWKHHIETFGVRQKDGTLYQTKSRTDAFKDARNLQVKTGVAYRPVRLKAFADKSEQLKKLVEDIQAAPEAVDATVAETLLNALDPTKGGDKGEWTLLPEAVAKRIEDHVRQMGGNATKLLMQKGFSIFRRSVLMSPTWLYGNTFEAMYRGLINGALPVLTPAWWFARRIIDELPTQDAKQRFIESAGTGHLGMVERIPHRGNVFNPEGNAHHVAEAAKNSRVGAKWLDIYARINHTWFTAINGTIEKQFRIAQAGRASQQLIDRSFLTVSRRAASEAAHGLTNTGAQNELARLVDRAYGKYRGYNPAMRGVIDQYTPFIAWALSALTFLTRVLPQDHPLLTGLYAAANQSSEDWRKSKGLVGFKYPGRAPDFLQGTLPGKNGSHFRGLTRFTPAGFGADPFGTLGSSVLPQLSGILAAFKGYNWNGTKLKDDSQQGRAMAALKELFGGYIPGKQIAQGVKDNGPAGYLEKPFKYTQASKKNRKTPVGNAGDINVPGVAPSEIEQAIQDAQNQSGAAPTVSQSEIDQAIQQAMSAAGR